MPALCSGEYARKTKLVPAFCIVLIVLDATIMSNFLRIGQGVPILKQGTVRIGWSSERHRDGTAGLFVPHGTPTPGGSGPSRHHQRFIPLV